MAASDLGQTAAIDLSLLGVLVYHCAKTTVFLRMFTKESSSKFLACEMNVYIHQSDIFTLTCCSHFVVDLPEPNH